MSALDLGNLVLGVADSYFTNRYQPSVDTPLPDSVDKFFFGEQAVTGAAGCTPAKNAIQLPDGSIGYVYKSKRRRRRRLATTGDIKDLAALKSVLGNGENFKMWIATRGGR